MTQQEFDREMAKINSAQQEAVSPIMAQMDEINQQKREVRLKIFQLRHEEDLLRLDFYELGRKRRTLNRYFHEQKHQLIMENPKDSMDA